MASQGQEVYVQRVGDPSHFKALAPGSTRLGRRGSASAPAGAANGVGARRRAELLSSFAVSACEVPDVLKLARGGEARKWKELVFGVLINYFLMGQEMFWFQDVGLL